MQRHLSAGDVRPPAMGSKERNERDTVTYATTVDGNQPVRLADFDPAADGGLTEEAANQRLHELTGELRELQELIYAA